MPIIKTLPLSIGSGVLAVGESSAYHGADVSEYIVVGIDVSLSTSATSGYVFVKIMGCNSDEYATNQKFPIINAKMDTNNLFMHFHVQTIEFRNIVVKLINSTNANVQYDIKLVGVRTT